MTSLRRLHSQKFKEEAHDFSCGSLTESIPVVACASNGFGEDVEFVAVTAEGFLVQLRHQFFLDLPRSNLTSPPRGKR